MKKDEIKVLQRTPEEEREIKRYQEGMTSTINELMGGFVSIDTLKMYEDSVMENVNYYDEVMLRNIMTSVTLIYSAMVKEAMFSEYSFRTLYRSTVGSLKEGENQAFLSTSLVKEQALLFGPSKYRHEDCYLQIYDGVSRSIPHIAMENFAGENEVLISPFVKVSKNTRFGEESLLWNEEKVPVVRGKIEISEPREVSKEEMQSLENNVFANINVVNEYIRQYIKLKNSSRSRLVPDMVEEKQISELEEKINGWKSKFRLLMEGKCREIQNKIEQDVNAEIDAAKQRMEAEKRELEEKKVQEKENALTIKTMISEMQVRLLKKVESKIQPLKNLNIGYESPGENIIKLIDSMESFHPYADNNTVNKIRRQMELIMNTYDMQESTIVSVEDNEFKRSINEKVLRIRTKQELSLLESEYKKLEEKKVGILGKISGKKKEKDDKIAELNGKIQTLKNFQKRLEESGLSHDFSYSTHDILAEIEIAGRDTSITASEKMELNGYKMAIYSVYKINESNVKSKVNDKSVKLASKDRSNQFVASNRDKIAGLETSKRKETSFETMLRNVVEELNNRGEKTDRDNSRDDDRDDDSYDEIL